MPNLTALTQQQFDSLVTGIYDKLMENPDFGLGERGECRDEAERLVIEWAELNGIELPE